MDSKIAKRGTLLQVDEGNYSDYGVIGFFVVLCDFYPMTEISDYLESHPEAKKAYMFESDAFLTYLIAKGFLLELDRGNFYLGQYQDPCTARFTPAHLSSL